MATIGIVFHVNFKKDEKIKRVKPRRVQMKTLHSQFSIQFRKFFKKLIIFFYVL